MGDVLLKIRFYTGECPDGDPISPKEFLQNSIIAELQLHHQEFIDAKETGHRAYEIQRELGDKFIKLSKTRVGEWDYTLKADDRGNVRKWKRKHLHKHKSRTHSDPRINNKRQKLRRLATRGKTKKRKAGKKQRKGKMERKMERKGKMGK